MAKNKNFRILFLMLSFGFIIVPFVIFLDGCKKEAETTGFDTSTWCKLNWTTIPFLISF